MIHSSLKGIPVTCTRFGRAESSTRAGVDARVEGCSRFASPPLRRRTPRCRISLLVIVSVLLIPGISLLPACGDTSDVTSGAPFVSRELLLSPVHGTGIDTSVLDQGYVGATAYSSSRLKFQVVCGSMSYNYDLPGDGTPKAFPLNMGDGTYTFSIMQNTSGDRYVIVTSKTQTVSLPSDTLPFIRPNIFCNYNETSAVVRKAKELVTDAENEGDVLRNVYTWIDENIRYDKEKAASVNSGYIPDPDKTLSSGKGICFDYASLAAAMLRSQGIPCKVLTGYITPDDIYHAWNMVYINGTWKTVTISVNANTWSRIDITLSDNIGSERSGSSVAYTDRYTY